MLRITAEERMTAARPEYGQREHHCPAYVPLLNSELQARGFGHRLAFAQVGVVAPQACSRGGP